MPSQLEVVSKRGRTHRWHLASVVNTTKNTLRAAVALAQRLSVKRSFGCQGPLVRAHARFVRAGQRSQAACQLGGLVLE